MTDRIVGASLGAFLAHALERRINDRDGSFGKGDKRGVAAPEAGNNAGVSGGLVPLLALGVPASGTNGDSDGAAHFPWHHPGTVAVREGARPCVGPHRRALHCQCRSARDESSADRVVRAHAEHADLGVDADGDAGRLRWHLSISHSPFDILTMVFFGVFGYVLRRLKISHVPIVLGLVLGAPMETNLRRALNLSNGDWTALFSSALSISLWVMAVLALVLPILLRKRGRSSAAG